MPATLDPTAAVEVDEAAPPAPTPVPAHHGWHPHDHAHHHVPTPGGSIVAAAASYEVLAVTVNHVLDLEVLPSFTSALRRFRWNRVFGAILGMTLMATMWATIAAVAATLTAIASRGRRR